MFVYSSSTRYNNNEYTYIYIYIHTYIHNLYSDYKQSIKVFNLNRSSTVFDLHSLKYTYIHTFINSYRKEKWKENIETSLKEMIRKMDSKQLYGNDLRNSVYKGQIPLFTYVDEMHRMEIVRSVSIESTKYQYKKKDHSRGDDLI